MKTEKNYDVFFALLRAGLWETEVRLLPIGPVDFQSIYEQSEYQSVVGLIAAGIEHVQDVKVPKEIVLTFVGTALQIENRNLSMNSYIEELVGKMRNADIYTTLIKGQGIAQCYERPLWRACGDVDLFLSDNNYIKAKDYLTPLASNIETEDTYEKHIGYTIDTWVVELHGRLRGGLSYRIDKALDTIQKETFYGGEVSWWINGKTQIFLLGVNNNIIYVFLHMLQHYFHGGVGLRQICDWCRLLWTYRDCLDLDRLEKRIRKMGILSEWKAFAYLAVNDLGLPVNTMPLYEKHDKWKRKAQIIKDYVLKMGNMGHRDLSYVTRYSYIVRKLHSLWNGIKGIRLHFRTFPLDSILFSCYYNTIRVYAFLKGE